MILILSLRSFATNLYVSKRLFQIENCNSELAVSFKKQ
ncbi:hypothetical protein LEP1GSC050_0587 [Leptospira broomii serovar Hurstbridge str. 5399]|uniref:Uncharacterized protein n=1 Tax=Leptospira broomii serovar Hurstbridge str. 5399 TaxID=1049789 RepID=T0FHN7_9LEPT|nr:hypothetical protein LEP1GSC050_0587 [Leptospira broomii serovar Hurstbridge str. 5399]